MDYILNKNKYHLNFNDLWNGINIEQLIQYGLKQIDIVLLTLDITNRNSIFQILNLLSKIAKNFDNFNPFKMVEIKTLIKDYSPTNYTETTTSNNHHNIQDKSKYIRDPPPFSIILVGNKCDLRSDVIDNKNETEYLWANECILIAEMLQIPYIELGYDHQQNDGIDNHQLLKYFDQRILDSEVYS